MKLKTLEVNPYVRYRLPKRRWVCLLMAAVWLGLAVLFIVDPVDPYWINIIFWTIDGLYFVGNVYGFVMYPALLEQRNAAERARQQMRAGTYWNKES